jgi:glyoxylase-like metal-dependent hydrolase (beta-lactamase superfamily II)
MSRIAGSGSAMDRRLVGRRPVGRCRLRGFAPGRSLRAALAALAALAAGASTADAQGRLGDDFQPGLVPIVDGVWVYEGPLHLEGEEEVVRTNSLVVVTDEGVVVVDGQDDAEAGRALLEAVREVTDQPIRYLVNASPHGDHVNSNAVFVDAGALLVGHAGTHEAMVEARGAVAAGAPPPPPLPDVTFQDRMTLRLGGRTVELHHLGRGHTRGDVVTFLPEEGVAFLSELYFNGVFASVSEGYAEEHLATLDAAMELPAEWWLPGHGYVRGQTPAQLEAGLLRYRANVAAIHHAVAARVARGESLEEVLEGIDGDLGDFTELPFYGYLKRSAVTGTYRALTGGP